MYICLVINDRTSTTVVYCMCQEMRGQNMPSDQSRDQIACDPMSTQTTKKTRPYQVAAQRAAPLEQPAPFLNTGNAGYGNQVFN